MWHCQLIDQDQAIHRTLFQVIYCQPSPSKHCTPKLAVFFWHWAKCHPVVAMLTAKKIYKPLACRLPRSNAQTLWTLNWQLVTPRSDLGVDPHISGPCVLSCHDLFPELSHIVIPTSSPLGLLHRPLLGLPNLH